MKKQRSSQMPLRKSLRRKAICLNCYLTQMKVSYSGKKKKKVILTSKGEKQVPGFKAQKNRLTLLFCANVLKFMMKIILIYKAINLQALNGKDKPQLTVFCLWNKKRWTLRKVALNWLSLKSGSTFPVRDCLLKVLWYWTMFLAHPEPNEFNIKRTEEWSTCP